MICKNLKMLFGDDIEYNNDLFKTIEKQKTIKNSKE